MNKVELKEAQEQIWISVTGKADSFREPIGGMDCDVLAKIFDFMYANEATIPEKLAAFDLLQAQVNSHIAKSAPEYCEQNPHLLENAA